MMARWKRIRVSAVVDLASDMTYCPVQGCNHVIMRCGTRWRGRGVEPDLANGMYRVWNSHTLASFEEF